MDDVFRALNDATRRDILDLLHEKDGRTTTEIEQEFPNMTRFGVIKHLRILEAASLVTTHKEGRFKYHYLNVVPLQEVADRWISRFRKPWALSMVDLKQQLEKENIMSSKPKHIYVQVIKTTPEKLWDALTNSKVTPLYYYGGIIETDAQVGSEYKYQTPDGQLLVTGKIIESDKPKKLVMTFSGHWMPDMKDDAPSKVTYEIQEQSGCCRLTLIHEFEAQNATYHIVDGGWPGILSGLKTLLETGEPLNYNPMAA